MGPFLITDTKPAYLIWGTVTIREARRIIKHAKTHGMEKDDVAKLMGLIFDFVGIKRPAKKEEM